ncbi:MAG: PAS domain S-box protein [Deltaproteobacteria bacterium]|nr:PAS domain S-box protein [Deltaproteobacteria bacterium]
MSTPSRSPSAWRQLRTVFDISHDGLWIIDGRGVIVNLNRAAERLNGVAAADVIGRSIDDLVAQGVIDASVTRAVLTSGATVSMVQTARRTGRQLIVTGTPSLGPDGTVEYVVVNDRDVTETSELSRQLDELRRANERLRDEMAALSLKDATEKGLVAESPQMREVVRVALRLARKNVTNILLLGESGTGKGVLARFIHSESPRAERPFVQINCAALPETLLEAELFGYEKGAFTGASDAGKPGLLEVADGGTLFLDELGDMPFSIQAKILKYLDDHEIRRLGSTRVRRSWCAVIAATNQDLEALVKERRFRHDLFYRLNTFTVRLPPLRERRADVLPLAMHFLSRYGRQFGARKRLGRGALRWLERYPFPGNVRELEGIIKNAVVMCEDEIVDDYLVRDGAPLEGESRSTGAPSGTLSELLEATEREALLRAAAECSNTREMAQRLGVSQPTVVRKLRRHGIPPPGAPRS